MRAQENDVELDPASGYESDTDFRMEPGESYFLCTAVAFTPGKYLATLTAMGKLEDDDFWRGECVRAIGRLPLGRCVVRPRATL
jgi:hypothetical protein